MPDCFALDCRAREVEVCDIPFEPAEAGGEVQCFGGDYFLRGEVVGEGGLGGGVVDYDWFGGDCFYGDVGWLRHCGGGGGGSGGGSGFLSWVGSRGCKVLVCAVLC